MEADNQEISAFNAELRELLIFWCTMNPKQCRRECYNIRSCKENTRCEPLQATGTRTLYDSLVRNMPQNHKPVPSSDYIGKFFGGVDRNKITLPFKNLYDYLKEYKSNPCKDNDKLNDYISKFDSYYKKWNLPKAMSEIKKGIIDFPFHPEIIRRWALIHNRLKRWGILRTELTKKLERNESSVSLECYLGIFESHLNEYTEKIHNPGSFKNLEKAREENLDKIPDIEEDNGQYHYFLARFLEEQWINSSPKTQTVISPILRDALDSINMSISKYEDDQNLSSERKMYSGVDIPYWLYAHKCILLKLLRHREHKTQIDHYGKIMEEKLITGLEQKTVQIYSVTYYLLRDSLVELKNFFKLLNEKIKQTYTDKGEKYIEPRSIVDNFTFHHVDLIFYDNENKRQAYIKILNDWFNDHIIV